MADGQSGNIMARGAAALAVVCGLIGLAAGLQDRVWKLTPTGWFAGGSLLALLAVFLVLDASVSTRR